MSLTFGIGRINAVHATFNSIWTFLFHTHRRSRHTERSWQSRNSSLLVTSSHVVITTTHPIRISSQTKRSKIINELAPRRWNSAKHEVSFCNFHLCSYRQIKLHMCMSSTEPSCPVNLPEPDEWLSHSNVKHVHEAQIVYSMTLAVWEYSVIIII
jgi:hypothetical protein